MKDDAKLAVLLALFFLAMALGLTLGNI